MFLGAEQDVAQEVESRPATHLAFDHLAVDVAFE
jgi:hypothetical protein